MAIIGPMDLPSVCKMRTEQMKKFVLSRLGYSIVSVEMHEDQWESIWRVCSDFIASYFPREQKLALFYTQPLQSTYPLPTDAYWVQQVNWDPMTPRVDDLFGAWTATFMGANSTGISGMQSTLLDFHLLQSYIKFANKVLGTEGSWEVLNEGTPTGPDTQLSAKDQLIRLYPTPKGAFPVVVLYIPTITHFRSPQARALAFDLMTAEAKMAIGHARRKGGNIPGPDGGTISYDGSDMVSEGQEMKDKILEQAINLGEPMPIMML